MNEQDKEARWERPARWALFTLGAVVILLRYPDLFTDPRIWGEEGSVYLRDAYAKPWQKTLFAPALGYFGLFSSVPSTLAAHLVPLRYVPTFLEAVGFATQLCPVALIAWGRAPLWKNFATRVVGLCILLFNPLGEELWLNTTCIQFHFVIVVFLLLLEPDEASSGGARWVQRALLVVSGLSGPPPCSLAPLFGLRWLVTRTREAFLRAAFIAEVALLEVVIVLSGMRNMIGREDRFAGSLDLASVTTSTLGKSVIVPLFGVGYGTSFAVTVQKIEQAGVDAYRTAGLACAVLLGLVAYFVGRSAPLWDRVVYLGSAASLIATAMILGIGDRHTWVHPLCAARYYYAPGVILLWFMLSQLDLRRPLSFGPLQRSLAFALVVGLGFQVAEWRSRLYPPEGMPHWQDEIGAYHRDPTHRLGIWPTGWGFEVPPGTR